MRYGDSHLWCRISTARRPRPTGRTSDGERESTDCVVCPLPAGRLAGSRSPQLTGKNFEPFTNNSNLRLVTDLQLDGLERGV